MQTQSEKLGLSSALPLSKQLSMRVSAMLVATLVVGLMAIGITLYLSWQLEGAGAAINAAGSLRMQTYKIGLTLEHYATSHDVALLDQLATEQKDFSQTLTLLRNGDPTRPLYLPADEQVRHQFAIVELNYQRLSAKWYAPVMLNKNITNEPTFRADLGQFVVQVNQLVLYIERFNSQRTLWLRLSQTFLIIMAIAGAVAQIYLMFLLIFRPLDKLRDGITRMAEQDFTVRLPVETQNEFGEVQHGFNQMADRLAESYDFLERRVQEKTLALNRQNRELSLLYDVAAFVNAPHTVQTLCQGVLEYLTQWFEADAGSVRMVDPMDDSTWSIANQGLSDNFRNAEACRYPKSCYCSQAQVGGALTAFICDKKMDVFLPCVKAGFTQINAFPVGVGEAQTGFITLFFVGKREISERETQLLSTLGQHLGIALENLRLAARDRELAISEERNLMAQGLHDSIAQGLTFLNLQVQMLDDSLKRNQLEEAKEVVPMLRAGVTESYEDVRELLLNFRTRLQEGDFPGTMRTVIEKFRKQTGVPVILTLTGKGRSLLPDEQLQLLFIFQEALSNIRKHAQATQVVVTLHNDVPLQLTIKDNGQGFDVGKVKQHAERHVGLSIMRERAERLGAQLEITNHNGVSVVLTIAHPDKQ